MNTGAAALAAAVPFADRRLPILGVPVADLTMDEALAAIEGMLKAEPRRSHSIFFVNAHTLNVACDEPPYREVLRSAAYVFGDGTGVRWGIRALHRLRLRDNVNGTDLVPQLFHSRANLGYRYFLLGNTPERIERAAAFAREQFPGWHQAGYHHGYLKDADAPRIIDLINRSGAHVLLVGMGNPKQETWIARHLPSLTVPVCMGTGGLFDYWSGDLDRAPRWMRAVGYEWLHLLIRQPHKAGRYLIGNPKFLARIASERLFKRY